MSQRPTFITCSVPPWILLQLLFVGLKLGGAIDWQWRWVLTPLWIVIGFYTLVLIAGALSGVKE